MKFFTLLTLLPLSTALLTDEDVLFRSALASPAALSSLLSSHLQRHPELHYDSAELGLRARVFRRELGVVERCNAKEQFHCTLNKFSTMSEGERSLYLGLARNTTGPSSASPQPRPTRLRSVQSKDWRQAGAVTSVKDQGTCGACWAFAGVGSLEGAYAVETGVLKSFSVQEMLECTYEKFEGYEGCGGGWYYDGYDYIKRSGSHLTTRNELPYEGKDGACRGTYPNGLIAAELTGYVEVGKDDWSMARAIALTPVGVAMFVAGEFFSYSTGVYDGRSDCWNAVFPNHALTAVGFTPHVFIIKNSWGAAWGESGFVRVQRGYDVCMINQNSIYPTLVSTGNPDDYEGDKEDEEEEKKDDCGGDSADCKDRNTEGCPKMAAEGNCYKEYMLDYAVSYCKRSCRFCNNTSNLVTDCAARVADRGCGDKIVKALCPEQCCGSDEGECPGGTTLCPDGECRHVHMC